MRKDIEKRREINKLLRRVKEEGIRKELDEERMKVIRKMQERVKVITKEQEDREIKIIGEN